MEHDEVSGGKLIESESDTYDDTGGCDDTDWYTCTDTDTESDTDTTYEFGYARGIRLTATRGRPCRGSGNYVRLARSPPRTRWERL